jgi:hypothetical protein
VPDARRKKAPGRRPPKNRESKAQDRRAAGHPKTASPRRRIAAPQTVRKVPDARRKKAPRRRPPKNSESKAQKKSRLDTYYQYARAWIFCGNAGIAGFSTACC